MKKKIVSVILVAAMAVGCLAGCGSKEAKNEDAFYIGGIGPVTGDAARTVHRLLSMRLMKPVELTVIRLNIISRMIRETLKRQQTHTTP